MGREMSGAKLRMSKLERELEKAESERELQYNLANQLRSDLEKFR